MLVLLLLPLLGRVALSARLLLFCFAPLDGTRSQAKPSRAKWSQTHESKANKNIEEKAETESGKRKGKFMLHISLELDAHRRSAANEIEQAILSSPESN